MELRNAYTSRIKLFLASLQANKYSKTLTKASLIFILKRRNTNFGFKVFPHMYNLISDKVLKEVGNSVSINKWISNIIKILHIKLSPKIILWVTKRGREREEKLKLDSKIRKGRYQLLNFSVVVSPQGPSLFKNEYIHFTYNKNNISGGYQASCLVYELSRSGLFLSKHSYRASFSKYLITSFLLYNTVT